jgi:hypothetical protein
MQRWRKMKPYIWEATAFPVAFRERRLAGARISILDVWQITCERTGVAGDTGPSSVSWKDALLTMVFVIDLLEIR